jgi:hypothetical protein
LAAGANTPARKSDAFVTSAPGFVGKARTYSDRPEPRETEHHDVQWDGEWEQPGTYIITKRGIDEAHTVTATVMYPDHSTTAATELMSEDGAILVFEFADLWAEFQADERIRQRLRQASEGSVVSPPAPPRWFYLVDEHITWTTKLGITAGP